ncbi:membrane protein insertase YidC [Terrabacter sp. 2RAF25]|uniref:membrane protein insertase YidC n=1 Tax=Terrabacter sp. 2RAF25 TaxID=3232998 RepID=UPI003F9887ED
MPDLLSTLLSPVVSAAASVLAATHTVAGALGLAPGSAGAWPLAIALLVVAVRVALLPFVVHGVRSAHARARATLQLRALQQTYAGRRDLESLQRMRLAQKEIHAEHGVSSWSFAPMLLQLPLVYALYRVVSDLASGHGVGALDAGLVASAGAASVVGLHLTSRVGTTLATNLPGGLVLVALALVAAGLAFATQRFLVLPATDLTGQPGAMVSVQRAMPWLSASGVLVGAAFVPAGLLVYWVLTNAWTFAQQAVITRVAPTPGSPAAALRR